MQDPLRFIGYNLSRQSRGSSVTSQTRTIPRRQWASARFPPVAVSSPAGVAAVLLCCYVGGGGGKEGEKGGKEGAKDDGLSLAFGANSAPAAIL